MSIQGPIAILPGNTLEVLFYEDYIATSIAITGVEGNLTILKTNADGFPTTIDLSLIGTQEVSYVEVQDITITNGLLRVYNGIDNGNNHGVIFLPKISFNNILNDQTDTMSDLIKTMTISNGYHNDWSTINQRNYAIGTWPRAEIYSISEENVDKESGLSCNSYTNVVNYEIHIAGKLNISSTNPIFDVIDIHNLAIDDLLKLFGLFENRNLNGNVDSILYKGFVREIKSVDQFIPTKLITKWRVVYSQDRNYPSEFPRI